MVIVVFLFVIGKAELVIVRNHDVSLYPEREHSGEETFWKEALLAILGLENEFEAPGALRSILNLQLGLGLGLELRSGPILNLQKIPGC